MVGAKEVRDRKMDLAVKAGERWNASKERYAETVSRLRMGGPALADTPERVEKYRLRESLKTEAYIRAGVTTAFFSERRIGLTLDLDEAPPNEAARTAGMPVGRIGNLDANGRIDGFATGFLIAPNLLLTNHHVFATASDCENCGVNFGYEKIGESLAQGTVYPIDPAAFFFSDEELDFAVVGVSPVSAVGNVSLSRYGTLLLVPTNGKILVGQPLSIIQYPDGGPKRYGVRNNELLIPPDDADNFLQYSTDTLPGSSGSPGYNKDWEVVALHHSGVPEIKDGLILAIDGTPWTRDMSDSRIHWIANEGVRVSKVCAALQAAQVDPQREAIRAALVATFHEDLSKLPALQSPRQPAQGDANAIAGLTGAGAGGGGAMSITVNGTANFYYGVNAPPTPAPMPAIASAALATTARILPAVEKKLRFDRDYSHRPGYDQDFLGIRVPAPGIKEERESEILKAGGKPLVLKYHHYSVVMNHDRRLQMWSAANVDYTPAKRRKTREEFGTDTWVPDPRIPAIEQIEDAELYDPAKKFDRGHIVRREDTAWGDTALEEVFANSDSFHWTNCTPQHEQFNRDMFAFHGLWGGLENQIQSQAKNVGNRMSILAGPVLDNENDIRHDFGGGEVLVPTSFWKVLVVAEDADSNEPVLRAHGFLLDQKKAIDEFGIEKFGAGKFETYRVTLEEISQLAGVTFDGRLLDADILRNAPDERKRVSIERLEDTLVSV